MTAITALTAQNTEGVFGIHGVPAPFVAQQMKVVLDDIGAGTPCIPNTPSVFWAVRAVMAVMA
jgi:hypothetical protein